MDKGHMSPLIKLNDGTSIPALGLGTYPHGKPSSADIVKALETAIDLGYRHLDTAATYNSEREVGLAVRNKINQGVITREDVYITTKLWSNKHRPDLVVGALKESLSLLQMDYVDLYLIHTPVSIQATEELYPMDDEGKILIDDDIDIKDVWREMEHCKNLGLTKSIGISNFRQEQVQYILDNCAMKPAINQIECHPFLTQKSLVEHCIKNDVMVSAYSPLVQPVTELREQDDPKIAENTVLEKIGQKHNKTVAQVALRFQIQRGLVVLPKSFNKNRQEENMQIFNFVLNDLEMTDIFGLNVGFGVGSRYVTPLLGHSRNYLPNKGD